MAGGKFTQGTGGATHKGKVPTPIVKSGPSAQSKENAQVANLSKRMHGAGGTTGYPK